MSFFGDIGSSLLDTGLNVVTFGGYGANKSANAAQSLAEAQFNAQQDQQKKALEFANMTPDEMKTLEEQLSFLEKSNAIFGQQISNSSAVLSALNPAFITAGQQAVDLMNGKSAPTIAPIQAQVDRQRQQLQTQLAQMYGPGWSSSSAGIEAMQRFEEGAQGTIAKAQQDFLGTLLNSSAQGASINSNAMTNMAQAGSGMFATAQGVMRDYNKLKLDALTGSSLTSYSGAGSLAAMKNGAFSSNQGQMLDMTALSYFGAKPGGKKPSPDANAATGGGDVSMLDMPAGAAVA